MWLRGYLEYFLDDKLRLPRHIEDLWVSGFYLNASYVLFALLLYQRLLIGSHLRKAFFLRFISSLDESKDHSLCLGVVQDNQGDLVTHMHNLHLGLDEIDRKNRNGRSQVFHERIHALKGQWMQVIQRVISDRHVDPLLLLLLLMRHLRRRRGTVKDWVEHEHVPVVPELHNEAVLNGIDLVHLEEHRNYELRTTP